MGASLLDALLVLWPLWRVLGLLRGKPRRAALLHWLTWFAFWAALLLLDTATLGLLPLLDTAKLLWLTLNYSERATPLSLKLATATWRHVRSQPQLKAALQRTQRAAEPLWQRGLEPLWRVAAPLQRGLEPFARAAAPWYEAALGWAARWTGETATPSTA